MTGFNNNACIRCGKTRITLRTWKETIVTASGKSVITHTQTVCPDPACQKLVDAKFNEEKLRSEEIKRNFDKRALEKKAARAKLRENLNKSKKAKKK